MSSQEIKKLLDKDYVYPDLDDKNLQSKIYKKREFYYHKIPEAEQYKNYNDIKKYRDDAFSGALGLLSSDCTTFNLTGIVTCTSECRLIVTI